MRTLNRSMASSGMNCLNEHWFTTLAQARAVIAEWRRDYNASRPHSALGYMTPAEFAAAVRVQPVATDPVDSE